MQGFKFKYENLLEVKQKYEDAKKGKLNQAQSKLKKEKMHLTNLENYQTNCHIHIASKMEAGVNVGHLKNYHTYLVSLKKNIDTQVEKIEKCNHEIITCRNELIQASKEKKTFEKLKEKAKETFHEEQKKEEANFVDQLVTFKNFSNN
ncbi:flagellar export protein FliJ [Inediibacterium massiliense]|uniref:flagellar export protein FliJ n=1 Tax=Inediibacterium massiliense TaxID=1658111 RepID=UPI0006B415EB|nr:flagellar export protein FliJ [Inediibacterium massiliense]